MYNLIGVYGLNERSKQDTLAEAIQEHYGYINYRISALPELMIGHVLQALGYSTRRINTLFQNTSLDSAIPELGISLKRLAKTLEINWGIENVKYDFWERCAVAYITSLREKGLPVFVSDLSSLRQVETMIGLGAVVFSLPRHTARQPVTGPGIYPVTTSDPDILLSVIETKLALFKANECTSTK